MKFDGMKSRKKNFEWGKNSHVQPIVERLADVQTVSLSDVLYEPVRCHRIARKPIQIEVRYSRCQSSTLQANRDGEKLNDRRYVDAKDGVLL